MARVGLPAAPSPDTRLNIIKIALSVVAGVGGVVALFEPFIAAPVRR